MSHLPLETCREELKVDRCNKPAILILWGKLFPQEALGPRCLDHAAKHMGWAAMSRLDQWAVFDLRGLVRADGMADKLDELVREADHFGTRAALSRAARLVRREGGAPDA